MPICPLCHKDYGDYHEHIMEEHPISCEDVRSKADDFVQGRLSKEDNDRVEFHLSRCRSCHRVVSRIWNKKVSRR